MQIKTKPVEINLRALKLRAAIEVLGCLGLMAMLALLIYAPSLVFGGDPRNNGEPLVVLARSASAR